MILMLTIYLIRQKNNKGDQLLLEQANEIEIDKQKIIKSNRAIVKKYNQ